MDLGEMRRSTYVAVGLVSAAFISIIVLWSGPASASAASCPNEALRDAASATLPDCRAYELVSSSDANGRLLWGLSSFGLEISRDLFPTELASPSKDSIVYEAYSGPLPNLSEPNGVFDVYEAQRFSTGWQTVRRLSPSGPQSVRPTSGGVSSDHSYAFSFVQAGVNGFPVGSLAGKAGTDYLVAPDGSFELTGIGSLGSEPLAQGRYISPDGEHVIFSTGNQQGQSQWCTVAISEKNQCAVLKLEEDAGPTGTGTIYDRAADGPTHVVSLLPGNVPQAAGQQAFYKGASKDGSAVAFEIEGTLYLRKGDVTKEVAGGSPTYAGLSADGEYLFYLSGGDLQRGDIHRFDFATAQDHQVNATGDAEVVNISLDGSHAYFISESQIGGNGTAGQPNLYVWSGGSVGYVATVAPSDLESTSGGLNGVPALTRWTTYAVAPLGLQGLQDIERGPGADSSRTTFDGRVLVFESRAQLTSYDNEGHTEIYRWDDEAKGLVCVSCNPSAEPATADARLQELKNVRSAMVIHNLTDDGARVFFETEEALAAADTDGVNDIYEWQQEDGATRVDLISSGRSTEYTPLKPNTALPSPNLLLSITPDGRDVVFLSQDNLTGGAGVGGVPAIYDARVNGGFPMAEPSRPCSEEECRRHRGVVRMLDAPRSKTTGRSGNVRSRRGSCHRRKRGKGKRCHAKNRSPRHRHGQGRRQVKISSAGAGAGGETQTGSSTSGYSKKAGAGSEATVQGAAAPVAAAAPGGFEEFGINSVAAKLSTAAAAQHPDFTTFFKLNYHVNSKGFAEAYARPGGVSVSLPPGLLGNPNAVKQCSTGQFDAFANCSPESQVGVANILVSELGELTEPIYNLTPPHPDSEVARFGFQAFVYPVFIDVKIRTASDYGVTAIIHGPPGLAPLLESETTFWGNPSDPSHDELRLNAKEALGCNTACEAPGGKREVPRTGLAFMTNPAACEQGDIGFSVTSYQLPGQVFSASAPLPAIEACQGVPFSPSFSAEPTSHVAGAATGLQTKLVLPQHLGASEPATATMREARVTLPQGMGVNPAAANWIEACSAAQIGYHQEVDAACPEGSKLGTATIKSPALAEPIGGNLYQRTPEPGHQLGLWLAVDALGLHVKLPGELEPDKQTGRLTAVFRDLPQVPVEEIDLNVWGGERAPLINPSSCGAFQTAYSFAPHSNDPAVTGASQMQITEGCNRPFDPKLIAGTTKPVAGKHSPLIVDLERPDSDQALRGFRLELPDGLLAKIKGVGRCSDAQATAGSCPADSKIGTVTAVAGAGPDPLWIPQPGRAEPGVYLGGPYEDSPLSVVTIVPAQAGPFDLGSLVVRSGLGLDPDSNRPVIKADPLPQFFEGVGLSYRKLHVLIDRPGFALNPTDCRAMKVQSTVSSTQGTMAHPSAPFQVKGCKRLKFAPKLSLKLSGGTERSDYPALTATLKARKGDANIARARVGLPHSEFLAQEHIQTICTRKQFAAAKCPKGSVYGTAKAWTPLLAKPLSGPVYLRSSSHPLPDMVAALHGELDVNLVGEIDSHNGGIRTTFASVPDAPVTKFVLRMKGGKKGLLVNSTDVCAHPGRAQADFTAQNGRGANLRPRLEFSGCGGSKRGKGGRR